MFQNTMKWVQLKVIEVGEEINAVFIRLQNSVSHVIDIEIKISFHIIF